MNEVFAALPAHPEHRPWPRRRWTRRCGAPWRNSLAAGETTLLGLWGEPGMVHMALLDKTSRRGRQPRLRRRPVSHRSLATIRQRAVWSGPSTTSTASKLLARPTRDPGSIMGAGRREKPPAATPSCRASGRGCTRFRLARSMPALSSPVISVSPPAARPWFVWRKGSAMPTRASRASWPAPRSTAPVFWRRACPATARSPVRCFFARRRKRAGLRGARSAAIWVRALMAELERLANHFGDIGAICNDAAFALMLAHCSVLRERVLRACDVCFGHRLMMDVIVPGGVRSRSRFGSARRAARPRGDPARGLPAIGRTL